MKILLISTIVNRSLKTAIDSVRDLCNVELIYSYELHKLSREELQRYVDQSDLILLDVRGDPAVLKELDFKDKDVIVLVGGSTLMSRAKLGKFKMPARVSSEITNPESLKRRIEMMQKSIETLGKILPFGVLKDARDYIKTLRYWSNAGFENYRNMFLHLCKVKGIQVEVKEPEEFPEYGFYHPDYGFSYIPKVDPEKPTVGIVFYGGMHFENCTKTLEMLAKKFENFNFVPVFSEGILNLKALEKLYEVGRIDALISMLWFRLNGGPLGGDPAKTIEILKNAKTKLFTPALMFNQKIEDWQKHERGLNPVNLLASVTLPEMDGAVEPIPVCGVLNDEVVPIDDRVKKFAERVGKWVELNRKQNSEKRVAIVIYNYPPGEENLGKAAYLDTFKSIEIILKELIKRGYKAHEAEIEKLLLTKNLFNPSVLPEKMLDCPRLKVEDYLIFFNGLEEELRKEIIEAFGKPPGELMVDEDGILIPAVILGNVAIVVQPARKKLSSEEDLYSAIHDRTKPPHHQYLATYFWLQKVFKADAVIHLGTHGTAELMKGKEAGLSGKCYPDILIGSMPNIYVYHVVNTSEGTIAKRRLYSTLISYNSPPYTFSGLYEDYLKLEDLIEEYRESLGKEPARAEVAKRKALEIAKRLNLGENIEKIELKLYEFKRSIIPKGLHVIGERYGEKELKDFMLAVSLRKITKILAERKGWSLEDLNKRKLLEREAEKIVERFLSGEKFSKEVEEVLRESLETAKKFVDNSLEITNLFEALEGKYVEPSVGGDVIRNPEALPTGRNIYQFDPLKVPTEGASERGKKIAEETLKRFYEGNRRYPETVAVVLWGFETAKTYGETVAQVFEYLGVEVVHKTPWEKELKVRSLEELKRPRVDVVVTICGFFREMFPNVVELIDRAFKVVSELEEPENMNFVRKHKNLANCRIFGPRATEYGTRMLQLVEDSAWSSEEELSDAYLSSMCFAYGREFHGIEAKEELKNLLKTVELVSQIRSSNDYEVTDLDHYYEFFGGLAKSVEILKGEKPEMIIADSTREDLKVESLNESIERGSITRTLNPLWIEEMLKHGFLGVQKIADRVENLLGFSATTNSVENWIWDKVAERFVLDEKMFNRLKDLNVYATKEIVEKLLEAEKRGYWKTSDKVRKNLEEKFIELDGILEEVIK